MPYFQSLSLGDEAQILISVPRISASLFHTEEIGNWAKYAATIWNRKYGKKQTTNTAHSL